MTIACSIRQLERSSPPSGDGGDCSCRGCRKARHAEIRLPHRQTYLASAVLSHLHDFQQKVVSNESILTILCTSAPALMDLGAIPDS